MQDRLLCELFGQLERKMDRVIELVSPRLSATLTLTNSGGIKVATILVGKTASSNWQEWSGPNGTGDKLPPAGNVTFASSNPSVATVDPTSGVVTGVAFGSAQITGTDGANNLVASDTVNVTEEAESATLTLVAN